MLCTSILYYISDHSCSIKRSMSDRGRASLPNPSGSVGGTSGGNLHRLVSSPDSSGPRRSHSTLRQVTRPMGTGVAGSNSRGAIDPVTGLTDPLADFAGVFRQITPHGLQMIGGHGEERADDYYSQEDDREQSIHTPRHSDVGGTPGVSDVADSQGSQLPLIHREGLGLVFLLFKYMIIDVVIILI